MNTVEYAHATPLREACFDPAGTRFSVTDTGMDERLILFSVSSASVYRFTPLDEYLSDDYKGLIRDDSADVDTHCQCHWQW